MNKYKLLLLTLLVFIPENYLIYFLKFIIILITSIILKIDFQLLYRYFI